jgi:hypothetical protein
VLGNFGASGTKTFDIPHPTKDGYRLRHRCIESPEARLIYESQYDCALGENTFPLPSFFIGIANKDVKCYVSPFKCFGIAWGETLDGIILNVHTNLAGTYNIMVVGTRMDELALKEWDEFGVEYPDRTN